MKRFVLFVFLALPLFAQPTAIFPTNIVTNEQLKVQVNGMQTTVPAGLTSTATTFGVAACGTIPANSLGTINQEIVAILLCAGNVITIDTSAQGCTSGRGCDGTVAAGHVSNTLLSLYVDAWHHNSLRVEVEAIETALGANLANVLHAGGSGSLVNLTLTGTLSGVAGAFSSTLSAQGAVAFGNNLQVTGSLEVDGGASISGLKVSGAAVATGASQISYGGTTAVSTNCGSLSGGTACIIINVAGTTRYIPYF